MEETTIIEHPFFDDYIEAFQSLSKKEVVPEDREKLRGSHCFLFPLSYLEERWKGWEIAIPRPAELFGKEILDEWHFDEVLFLFDFFKRVKKGKLYCDYSAVIQKHGEGIESRIGKTSGLQFNLEAVYWTFNVKFNKWVDQNIRVNSCSLICPLDEILARFDSYLREVFFPTPGPYDIGPKKRKKLQKQMLHDYAPILEKPLIQDIWG